MTDPTDAERAAIRKYNAETVRLYRARDPEHTRKLGREQAKRRRERAKAARAAAREPLL